MFTLYRIKGCFARESFQYMCKHIGWAHNSRAFVFNMADKTQTDSQGKKKEKTEFVWTDDKTPQQVPQPNRIPFANNVDDEAPQL